MRIRHISRLQRAEEQIHAAIPDKWAEEQLQEMRIANIRRGLQAFGFDNDDSAILETLADYCPSSRIGSIGTTVATPASYRGQGE